MGNAVIKALKRVRALVDTPPMLMRVLVLLLALGGSARAQVASWTVERQQWLTQSLSNTVTLGYSFETRVAGAGLASATLASPSASLPLIGTTFQQGFTTNYPALTITNGSIVSGLTTLNATFPTGAYLLTAVIARTNRFGEVTLATNDLNATLASDFPGILPAITNRLPFAPLPTSATFIWPVFSTTGGYVNFTLVEGNFDTNLIAEIVSGGTNALASLSLMAARTHLDPSENSAQVNDLDPSLDHLALLEFHAANANGSLPAIETSSTASALIYYRAESLRIAAAASGANVILTWPNNPDYQMIETADFSSWTPVPTAPTTNSAGQLQLTIPPSQSARFYELRSP